MHLAQATLALQKFQARRNNTQLVDVYITCTMPCLPLLDDSDVIQQALRGFGMKTMKPNFLFGFVDESSPSTVGLPEASFKNVEAERRISGSVAANIISM